MVRDLHRSRNSGVHLARLAAEWEIVCIGKRPTRARRQSLSHRGLARSGDTHQHNDHSLLFLLHNLLNIFERLLRRPRI